MADQAINALSTKTAPETSDQLLLVGTGEPQLIDYDKLADAILNKITSKNYALDAGQMTLLAALNKLNSESLILNNLLFYRSSGANIKSITISVNKDANRAFRYAPFIIFGHSSFLTGVTYSINSTNKVGDILTEYSFDDSSEKVTFSNLGEFPNIVIIIYYQNISKAKIEEK